MNAPAIDTAAAAAATGDAAAARDYRRIAGALTYVAAHARRQPTLHEVAAHAGLSEHHLQRLFTRWVGISPKRFLQHLTLAAARDALGTSASVLDAALEAGLSGPGRLHDLFVTYEAVTPGEYKQRGAGLRIGYGFHDSPFGEYLLLTTTRGVCGLEFVDPASRAEVLADARRRWPAAELVPDEAATAALHPCIFSSPEQAAAGQPLRLYLSGTRFQLKVWEALLRVAPGQLVSYQGVAARVAATESRAPAVRAVGSAVGENPIAWLIPCHRVLRKDGLLGGYRYGGARKLAMLGWEASQATPAA